MSTVRAESIKLHEGSQKPGIRIDQLLLSLNPIPGTIHEKIAIIQNALAALGGLISDAEVSNETTWSSQKIFDQIAVMSGDSPSTSIQDGILKLEETIDGTHVITERATVIDPVILGHVTVQGILYDIGAE